MRSDFDSGVPLAHYCQHNAGVRLFCLGCLHHRELPLEAVIERLKVRGLGDESTGIRAVAGFVAIPCPRCAGLRFQTMPSFPKGPGGAWPGRRHVAGAAPTRPASCASAI